MKILAWTVIPTHHQSGFYAALREEGVDLRVCYFGRVLEDRTRIGWSAPESLPEGELYVQAVAREIGRVPDWRERVHLVPGCRTRFLRRLCKRLSAEGAPWVHYGERAIPGLRWYVSWPLKRWYAHMVNRHALGAFGYGVLALQDFARWGIDPARTAQIAYAVPACDSGAEPDTECERFREGRPAFLFLGSLNRRKAIDVLIRAFARLEMRTEDWVLLLVGFDESGGRYARLARRLAAADRILFRGALPAADVAGALGSADVLLLPSRRDGWGVVVNEAASVGKALVASDRCGAAYELIQPGENGFRVRAGSTESLEHAMQAYVNDSKLAEAHGARSLELFGDVTPIRTAEHFLAALHSWRVANR